MVLDYYQKNPSASQSLKGSIYEEKIITLIKSKIKLEIKNLTQKRRNKLYLDLINQMLIKQYKKNSILIKT